MTTKIQFTKMQGLGNDFVVIDAVRQSIDMTPARARSLADRYAGVGCDQILIVEEVDASDIDFRYRIFNADGGEVQQCGNGARCFAHFVRDQGLTDKREIRVLTQGGVLDLKLESDNSVTVAMGIPEFEPEKIPFVAEKQRLSYSVDVADRMIEMSVLAIGNPHAVQLVDDVGTAPVLTTGAVIESHCRFPERVNAGFMQILDKNHVKLRVYERGVGETLACGSGACAAVVAGNRLQILNNKVQVEVKGGLLSVSWAGEGQHVYLSGPAYKVFEGNIELN